MCVCVCVDGSMHATSAEKGAEGKKSEKGTLHVWVYRLTKTLIIYTKKMMSLTQ